MLTTRMSPQVTCSLNDSSLEKFYKLERSLKLNGVGETKQVIQQRLLLIFEIFFIGIDSLVEFQPQVAVRGTARCPSYCALVVLRRLIW